LNFVSSEKTPFNISASKDSEQAIEVEGTADFYFWGKAPGVISVDLDDLQVNLGFDHPSFVSVEQTVGWKSFFFTALTLGLYCPVDYKVKVLTAKGIK
jgi:hypothetical protein